MENSHIPEGFVLSSSKYASEFDAEALSSGDKELWLIRVPENISPEDLVNMKIRTSSSKKCLSKLKKDKESYALYRVPSAADEEETDSGISGHEMNGFSCLLPSMKKNGKLVFAPKAFERMLILDEEVEIPDSTATAEQIRDTPVTKREHPEGLKMRFKPYGFDTEGVPVQNKEIKAKKQKATTNEKVDTEKKRKRDKDSDKEKKKKKSKKESS
ncbi:hypothetical protein EC973_001846 [Apophysomyces ossiformis]|uniref:DNA-directed RNA polymerase I subunit RPA34.5 n=1 Tax=Apophysomyces ossiformis TaxID=679940 RepID=A0A8H7BJ07_9FUNG|nr:hypothetical protein EC973_001846 [Apophysomyces ossiformis]